jgi:hypothetical protein
MGSTQSPGAPRTDTGRRPPASIGVRSGRLRADKAAGWPANRADGTVEPGSGPVAAAAPLDLAGAAPADTSDTRLPCPIPDIHARPRYRATSRRRVFVEANAPDVPPIAAYPTNDDIANLAAIDIVAHGARQLDTATPSVATPADDQTRARPTETAH